MAVSSSNTLGKSVTQESEVQFSQQADSLVSATMSRTAITSHTPISSERVVGELTQRGTSSPLEIAAVDSESASSSRETTERRVRASNISLAIGEAGKAAITICQQPTSDEDHGEAAATEERVVMHAKERAVNADTVQGKSCLTEGASQLHQEPDDHHLACQKEADLHQATTINYVQEEESTAVSCTSDMPAASTASAKNETVDTKTATNLPLTLGLFDTTEEGAKLEHEETLEATSKVLTAPSKLDVAAMQPYIQGLQLQTEVASPNEADLNAVESEKKLRPTSPNVLLTMASRARAIYLSTLQGAHQVGKRTKTFVCIGQEFQSGGAPNSEARRRRQGHGDEADTESGHNGGTMREYRHC